MNFQSCRRWPGRILRVEFAGNTSTGLGLDALSTLKALLHERSARAEEAEDAGGSTASAPLTDILGAVFRSNPDYELDEFVRLNPALQAALVESLSDDCFGLLRPPPDSGLDLKVVDKDTALLFYALRHPGRLPAFVTLGADEHVNALIVELVRDEVLQIAFQDEFVSGAAALDLVGEPTEPVQEPGRISRISLDALRFGQRAQGIDAPALAEQLYFFNRMPLTPRWQRCLGPKNDEPALAQFLGIDSGSLAAVLRAEWQERDRPTGSWRLWSLRDAADVGPRNVAGYQIYLSPTLGSIPDVLPAIVDVFVEKRVRGFRMGADLANLCRTDKIVAEVDSVEHLQEVGRALDERLDDAPAQGVPFTADLCRDGLISWGTDPWRRRITRRLADALLEARDAPTAGLEPWQFALQRARLDGINTDTWTPLSGSSAEMTDPMVCE